MAHLPSPSAPLRLALLGDSLAAGVGASRPQDAPGPLLATVLALDGWDVDLSVLAVSGAVTPDLASQVDRALPLSPDVVVVVVGANDLLRLLPAAPSARLLGAAVASLVDRGADVLVVPAPDLSSLSRVPPAFRDAVQVACRELASLQVEAVRSAGGVPLLLPDLPARFSADRSLLAADRFHPSSRGYALALEHLAPPVRATALRRCVRPA